MGIRADFLIKHVRPYSPEAWQTITTPGPGTLTEWLVKNGVDQESINVAYYDSWWATANLGIDQTTLPQFVNTAQIISQARWSELYDTDYSTIMFLDGEQLTELSWASAQNANQNFQFSEHGTIPLAVTINRLGQQPRTDFNVYANLAADAQGNCCHFHSLSITEAAADPGYSLPGGE